VGWSVERTAGSWLAQVFQRAEFGSLVHWTKFVGAQPIEAPTNGVSGVAISLRAGGPLTGSDHCAKLSSEATWSVSRGQTLSTGLIAGARTISFVQLTKLRSATDCCASSGQTLSAVRGGDARAGISTVQLMNLDVNPAKVGGTGGLSGATCGRQGFCGSFVHATHDVGAQPMLAPTKGVSGAFADGPARVGSFVHGTQEVGAHPRLAPTNGVSGRMVCRTHIRGVSFAHSNSRFGVNSVVGCSTMSRRLC